MRQRILTKLAADAGNVKYDEVVEECITFMTTISEAKMIESATASKGIYALTQKEHKKGKPTRALVTKYHPVPTQQRCCWRCGRTNHPHRDCPNKSAKCPKCNRFGHLESQCDKVQEWFRNNPKGGVKKNVGTLHIGTAMKALNSTSLLRLTVLVNSKPVEFVLDSGAEANVIDEMTYESINRPPIRKCAERGCMFDGTTREFIGKGKTFFEFKNVRILNEFFVAKSGSLNLLSVQTMDKFGLLDELKTKINPAINICSAGGEKRGKGSKPKTLQTPDVQTHVENFKRSFAEIFKKELGLCTKVKAHLTLKADTQPIYRKARPVPYNAKQAVEDELDRWEQMGVIEKVEFTEWAAPILVVKKADGAARLCIDYSTGLNAALQDHQHPLPLPEDIFSTLNGGKHFSQIDLRDAYLQVELDSESKKLCGIATHRGNYEVKRLPFGVKSAPGIFQSIMDQMLAGLDFATAYLDDVIVVSQSFTDHTKHLECVFERFQEWGLRIKAEKCSFFRDEIKYLGQIINKNGRRPDPNKISAIVDMPAPTDVSSLRSYLGMINHYQQFVKNMRFIRKPLDDLLKKDSEWRWSEKCNGAYEKMKEILTSNLLLTHYDPKKEIIVAADASEQGIGAVISHRFPDGSMKAIAHASSSLTPAEKNYSQIEKEALALIFAVQKFHKMIYGRNFSLLTDHKPLLAIFGSKKGIRQCSANRLLRWSLILLAYDFKIEYVNTKDFGQADALSRLIAKSKSEDDRVIASIGVDSEIEHIFVGALEALPIKFGDILQETQSDQIIKKVQQYLRTGWPRAIGNETAEIKLYHRVREQLGITRNCLMYADRVVIPEKLRDKILHSFHKGHPGIKRMKQRARQYVYWPKLDAEIEQLVQNCQPCQNAAKAPTKANLQSWPKATRPWQRVHIDYAGPFFGKDYLIIVDAFAKYPEVFEMPSKSTAATIDKLRYLCSRHGLPEVLVSDNGTQFASHEFANFTATNGIDHRFSAPYNPMSNGQAERFVDTFKRTFRKIKGEGAPSKEIIETFLVSYRTTPCDSLNGQSPAEMFLGRKVRTTFDLLKPPPPPPMERDEEMESRFNKRFGTKPREFSIGEKVFARYRMSQNWRPGKISTRTGVIYDVIFSDGRSGRFHANQLRPRRTSDGDQDDALQTFFETFDIPPPIEQENGAENVQNEQRPEPEVGNAELNAPANEQDQGQAVHPNDGPPLRRYPHRERRAPRRFSP